MKKYGILLISLFVLGCNFEQDPLAEYPLNIREGTPPANKPGNDLPANPPIIDINESYTVREQGALILPISARIFQPDLKYDFFIENLSDFEGARFDQVTDEFSWTPTPGTVVGGQPIAKILKVILRVEADPFYIITKDVTVIVIRNGQAPFIETVDNLSSSQIVYEGSNHNFQVKVRTNSPNEKPQLMAIPIASGASNAAALVTFNQIQPGPSPNDPRLWVFSMKIDAMEVDLTDSKESMKFGLQAFSAFGEASNLVEQSIVLYTSLMKPQTTWSSDLTFYAASKNEFEYNIYDPRGEGDLEIENDCSFALGGDAKCTCTSISAAKSCHIEWTPDLNKINRNFTLNIKAKNTSPNFNDRRYTEETFRRKIFVVAPRTAGGE